MRAQRAMVLALAAGGAMTAGAAGQCTPTPWGTVGSGVMAVSPVNTGRAVIGNGNRIELITIPASGTPTVVNAIEFPRLIKDIKGFGASAYAHDGMRVYRLDGLNAATNPLRHTSSFEPGGEINGMAHTGTHVYVWECGTLKVADFTTPAAPTLVASLPLNVQCISHAGFNNNRLYLTSPNQIHIVNVQNPSAPFLVRSFASGSLGAPGPIMATPNGTGTRLVYWHTSTSNQQRIQVVDLASDLATPVFRGSAPLPASIRTLATNLAVEWGKPGRVWSLNLSNPDAPTASVAYTDNDSRFWAFGSINGRWLLAGEGGGFTAVDSNVVTLRYGQRPAEARGVAFGPRVGSTTHAYVADGSWGLRTVRVQETSGGPILSAIGGAATTSPIDQAAYAGGFVLTAGAGGARCWDVTNPAAPVLRSTYEPTGTVREIATSGSALAAVVRWSSILNTDTLDLVDFAPITPQIRASLPLPTGESTRGLAMHGDLAARLTSDRLVLYRAAGSSIVPLTQMSLGTSPADMAFSGDYAYVLDSSGQISVLDLSTPESPLHLRTLPVPFTGVYEGIAVTGDWLATVGPRIHFYNIQDRTRPLLTSTAALPCQALDIAADESGFLVADHSCGVRAYRPPTSWQPMILTPPLSVTTCLGGTATFSMTIVAPPSATYQWQRYGNGQAQNIPGATQPTLTLTNVSLEDAEWGYRCVVTSSCGVTTSPAAQLRICYANCDCSTTPPALNVNDFICFQSKFAAGDQAANCDRSTVPPVLNVNDFICFQSAFAAGCP